jgi:hypothetical protein
MAGLQLEPVYGSADFDPDNRDNPNPDIPRYLCYETHRDFAPPYHFGLLLPQPAADPYATDDLLDHAVGEIVLFRVTAEIVERQDRLVSM